MRYNVSLDNFKDGTSRAHMIRYYFARGFVGPEDTVKDAACGTGYGSKLLSEVAKTVYAYDQLDKINYESDNLIYSKADLETQITYYETDITISLETIEHLTKEGSEHFVQRMLERTRKWFIFSVPLGEDLTIENANPWHKQSFTQSSIRQLVQHNGWMEYHSLMQGNHFLGVMRREQ